MGWGDSTFSLRPSSWLLVLCLLPDLSPTVMLMGSWTGNKAYANSLVPPRSDIANGTLTSFSETPLSSSPPTSLPGKSVETQKEFDFGRQLIREEKNGVLKPDSSHIVAKQTLQQSNEQEILESSSNSSSPPSSWSLPSPLSSIIPSSVLDSMALIEEHLETWANVQLALNHQGSNNDKKGTTLKMVLCAVFAGILVTLCACASWHCLCVKHPAQDHEVLD